MPKESHKAMNGESIAVRTSSLVPSGASTPCGTMQAKSRMEIISILLS